MCPIKLFLNINNLCSYLYRTSLYSKVKQIILVMICYGFYLQNSLGRGLTVYLQSNKSYFHSVYFYCSLTCISAEAGFDGRQRSIRVKRSNPSVLGITSTVCEVSKYRTSAISDELCSTL